MPRLRLKPLVKAWSVRPDNVAVAQAHNAGRVHRDGLLLAFVVLTVLAALSSLALALLCWQRREVPAAGAFCALMLAATVWCAAYVGELTAPSLQAKTVFLRLSYLGIAAVPPSWLLFCLAYAGKLRRRTPATTLAFYLLPLATVLFAMLGTRVPLVWSKVSIVTDDGMRELAASYGPWFWVHTAYSYVCLGLGSVVLLVAILRQVRVLTGQAAAFVFAVSLPWLMNVLTVFHVVPIGSLDLTPPTLVASGMLVAIGLWRLQMFDVFPALVPVAREAAIQELQDGVLVVDGRGCVLDANNAAEELFSTPGRSLVGMPLATLVDLTSPAHEALADLRTVSRQRLEMIVPASNGGQRHVEVAISSQGSPRRVGGHVLVMRDVTERVEAVQELAKANDDLRTLVELSGTLLTTFDNDNVFSRIATLVKRVVDYDCMEIRLVDPEARELYCAYASADDADYQANWRAPLDQGVSGWVVRHNEAQLVNDMLSDPRGALVEGSEAEHQASIIVPLTVDGDVIGVLALDRTEGRTFDELELEPAKLFANLAAIAIHDTRQYENVKTVYSANLQTLCTALNAKDYYTLGHTARVAAYMIMLGRELGWSAETVRVIGEAAYLHDIGKIGIPDRVLTKAGKLNDREWAMMREHPVISADIVRPLYEEDVVLGVRHHHERFDGRGYPDGLAGEQIPLIARAMCVADSYDAMSFERPYHRGLSFTQCLAELERCRGSQFDPVMVDAFLKVLGRMATVRAQALALGEQAAASIDAAAHRRLSENGTEADPVYAAVNAVLRQVRDENPGVRFVTTMARRGGQYVIVCDGEEDEAERSHLGEVIVADEELPHVLAGERPDICVVSADQFGVWISAMAPITGGDGEVVAAVCVDCPACGTAGEPDMPADVTQALTRLLEGAQERVRRVEEDATTDLLSGLYNHRYLHEGLAREIDQAHTSGEELSLVLCDVDHLERFNRRVGHPRGDEALRLIGQLVESASRPTDLCARFGGDEFAVVLRATGGAQAFAAAESLRAAIENAAFGPDGQSLTVSAGVATYPWDGQDKETLIGEAQHALDLAKLKGRNCCMGFAAQSGDTSRASGAHAIDCLTMMAELTDAKTLYETTHSEAVARLARGLAGELGLSEETALEIGEAARLRDIGQFTIPDDVLSKPGELSAEEWALIREHPGAGARLLRRIGMDAVADAVAHHHERFDGTGYPAALGGAEIPLAARIVAVASAFQALLNTRPYRPAQTVADALEEMRCCAGTQFDPDVVAALVKLVSSGIGKTAIDLSVTR